MTYNWKLRWRQIKFHTLRSHANEKTSERPQQRKGQQHSLIVAERRRFELSRWRSKASRATSNRRKNTIKEETKKSGNLFTEKYILFSSIAILLSYTLYTSHRSRCSQGTSPTTPVNRKRRSELAKTSTKKRNRIQPDQRPTKHVFGEQNTVAKVCLRFRPSISTIL